MMGRTWLRLDGKNRAWRTILQAFVVTFIMPALDLAYQAVYNLIASGASFSWRQLLTVAGLAFLTGLNMAWLAYVHRVKLDPTATPTAEPPRPPGVSAAQAPATVPVGVDQGHGLGGAQGLSGR